MSPVRFCAWPPCSRPFESNKATARCCSRGHALRLRWQENGQWRDPEHGAKWAARTNRLMRRKALDKLAATLGGPATARELAIYRLGYKTGWRVARRRWLRRYGPQ